MGVFAYNSTQRATDRGSPVPSVVSAGLTPQREEGVSWAPPSLLWLPHLPGLSVLYSSHPGSHS